MARYLTSKLVRMAWEIMMEKIISNRLLRSRKAIVILAKLALTILIRTPKVIKTNKPNLSRIVVNQVLD